MQRANQGEWILQNIILEKTGADCEPFLRISVAAGTLADAEWTFVASGWVKFIWCQWQFLVKWGIGAESGSQHCVHTTTYLQ